MLKRFLLGLTTGLIMGALVAALVVKGLGVLVFPAVLAYVFAAITGIFVGLVAGKPIWAKGGQIEAGLKAGVGAVAAAGGMFALREWANIPVDLSAVGAGHDALGQLPALSLPILAALLGAFYEIDNTDDPPIDKRGAKGAAGPGKIRVAEGENAQDEPESSPPKRAHRS